MARPENGTIPLKRGEFRVALPGSTKVLAFGVDGRASIDGREVSYSWERTPEGGGILRIADRVYRISPRGALPIPGTTATIEINGLPVACAIDDVRSDLLRSAATSVTGRSASMSVRAPMPGLVVRVEVKAGDQVAKGQGLVILEAMKMENELRADRDGVVDTIFISEKTPVEKGQELMTIRNA